MFRKFMFAGVFGVAVVLTGCGGSGSAGTTDNSSTTGGTSIGGTSGGQAAAVAGPLDTVQTAASSAVFSPLEGATVNTPLQGLLACGDQVVNGNLLDTADSLINGLQNPSSLASVTPAQVQAQLAALAQNLSAMLTSLAGQSACLSGSSGSTGVPTTNPLAGTPLAPLGDALLPVLQQFQQQLGSGSSGGGSSNLATLASLFSQLDTAYQSGLGQLPTSATSAPIVGGLLTTTGTAISDEAALLNAAAANDPTAFDAAAQTFVDHYLVNTLTLIVPTSYIEGQSGQSGTITSPIVQAAAQLSAAFGQALANYSPQLLNVLNGSQLASVFSPVSTQFLPTILGPISGSLTGLGGTGSSGSVTGTPLDAFLTPLITALNGLNGSTSSGTGSGTGTTGTCVFASLPLLSTLCSVIP